ncbi:MAG: right-handed parallel beta-helix repeat-containing protein, partial [Calditrichota bacterium]
MNAAIVPHHWKCSLIILTLLLSTTGLFGLDDVSGVLSSDVWTIEESPVRVTGDITLPAGQILKIEPGVRVEFTGAFSFVISGQLHAEGAAGQLIYFTAWEPPFDSLISRWKGIRFINSDRGSILSFCRIEWGWARGPWPQNCGGGLYIEGSSPSLQRCEIIHNRADGDGGGIYGWFTTSEFRNNLVVDNYSGNFGGGFFLAYSQPRLINCTIANDTARGWGGGLFLGAEAKPVLLNCIVVFNKQKLWNGGLDAGDEFFDDLARARSCDPVVTFSCIRHTAQDAFPGPGNEAVDPEFKNMTVRPFDYHLKPSSPCIDTGDPGMNALGELDRLINIVNKGAYGGTEEAALSVPVFFNDRVNQGVPLQFDSLRLDSVRFKEVNIQNKGHYKLEITDMVFSSSVFYIDTVEVDSAEYGEPRVPIYRTIVIGPGERAKIPIKFRPTELRRYTERVVFHSTDAVQDTAVLALTGEGIDPRPETINNIDYGNRKIGANHDSTIYVRNSGRSSLSLSSVAIQGDGFDYRIVDGAVAPNGRGRIIFTFQPTAASTYSAIATVRTNGGSLLIALNGTGAGPLMVVEEDSLFMGYVYFRNDTANYTIPIKNQGDSTLHISNVTVSHNAFSVPFPPEGWDIAALDSFQLPVRFHPSAATPNFRSNLTISSNYPIVFTVRLSGDGMAEPGRYVFGNVSGVWNWDPNRGVDYIVLDSVRIPAHQRLKIEPGARILFEPGAVFYADGELRAIGLTDDSIYFLPRDPSGNRASRWMGLELAHEDGTRLIHCVVSGSRKGISIRESSPIIRFCLVYNNSDTTSNAKGGGFFLENSGASIIGCEIRDNLTGFGGGIYTLNSKPTISNCLITGNDAKYGGGIYLKFQSAALIQNNLIYGNRAEEQGGGIAAVNYSNPRIVNNTIVSNTGSGVSATLRSVPILVNTVVYDNVGEAIERDVTASALVSYSDIQGGFRGNFNFDSIPGFIDPVGHDYHLRGNSPLVDKGNPEASNRDYAFPPSLGGARNDIGAYGGPAAGGFVTAEVTLSVFQNPAYPRWLDIYALGLDQFASAPVCSVEWAERTKSLINMVSLDSYTYHGCWEAPGSGTVFITAQNTLVNTGTWVVGRTFELHAPDVSGGTMSLAGVDGVLRYPSGIFKPEDLIIAGYDPQPIQPKDGLLPLTPVFWINNSSESFSPPLCFELPFNYGWDADKVAQVGVYRDNNGHWERLEGSSAGDLIKGKINRGGRFIVAWEDGFKSSPEPIVPLTTAMLSAYPNPFNSMTTI